MKIAVLGTGMVGQAIATKLVELGHEIVMGSRTATNDKALEWASGVGDNASVATFNDAASGSDVLFNCTNGSVSLEMLSSIDAANLTGKVLIDLANQLEVVDGIPRSLARADNSLAQQIQDAHPDVRVVKSLNTLNASLMVNPSSLPGHHNIFMSGNDADAKTTVREILESFGWPADAILDLGGIESAVGPEMFMSLWLSIMLAGTDGPNFNFNIAVVN